MSRKIFLPVVLVAIALGAVGYWFQSSSDDTNLANLADIKTVIDVQSEQADSETVVRDMVLGAENAPVTIIEYASFTCPHCANYHINVFGKLKSEYVDTGKVKFIMRDVYFDRFGLWAAMLARCDTQEKFFGLSDMIYRNQKEWTKGESNAEIAENLRKLGRLAGMDETAMEACLMDNAKAQALVAAYQQNAERDEITSTPTFIINGKKYPNLSHADFRDTINGLLGE